VTDSLRSESFVPERGALSRRAQVQERESQRDDRIKAIAFAALRVLGACALSALIGVGLVQGYQSATHSRFFSVRDVRVRGSLHATTQELTARSGLLPGQNLFRVDLAAAARGVESSPWVISASVSRQLPSSIDIELREHVPVARVQLGLGNNYFSDDAGKLFKRVTDDDDLPARSLPLVTGLERADWDSHRDDALTQLSLALQLVSDWHEAGLPSEELSEVRADKDGAFSVIAKPSSQVVAQEIRVGKGPFAANLHRLIRVRTELSHRGAQASHIDLDNPARPDEVAAQIVRNDDPSTARNKAATARGE